MYVFVYVTYMLVYAIVYLKASTAQYVEDSL